MIDIGGLRYIQYTEGKGENMYIYIYIFIYIKAELQLIQATQWANVLDKAYLVILMMLNHLML